MSIDVDAQSDSLLQQKIYDASHIDVYRRTKGEIVQYYQDTYGRSWQKQIKSDLAPIAGISEKNLARRFNPSRVNNPEKKNAGQYEQLGRTLPPVKVPRHLKGRKARVTFRGTLWFSKKAYPKSFTVTLNSDELAQLVEEQSLDNIVDDYGINSADVEEAQVDDITIDIL